MLILEPTFILKVIMEAVVKCGWNRTTIYSIRPKQEEDRFEVHCGGSTLFTVSTIISQVVEIPAKIFIFCEDVDPQKLIQIAEEVKTMLGDKAVTRIS